MESIAIWLMYFAIHTASRSNVVSQDAVGTCGVLLSSDWVCASRVLLQMISLISGGRSFQPVRLNWVAACAVKLERIFVLDLIRDDSGLSADCNGVDESFPISEWFPAISERLFPFVVRFFFLDDEPSSSES